MLSFTVEMKDLEIRMHFWTTLDKVHQGISAEISKKETKRKYAFTVHRITFIASGRI